MNQAIAALSDPQGRLSERAAREHLRLDKGAEFDTAYEVSNLSLDRLVKICSQEASDPMEGSCR